VSRFTCKMSTDHRLRFPRQRRKLRTARRRRWHPSHSSLSLVFSSLQASSNTKRRTFSSINTFRRTSTNPHPAKVPASELGTSNKWSLRFELVPTRLECERSPNSRCATAISTSGLGDEWSRTSSNTMGVLHGLARRDQYAHRYVCAFETEPTHDCHRTRKKPSTHGSNVCAPLTNGAPTGSSSSCSGTVHEVSISHQIHKIADPLRGRLTARSTEGC
jgi:hypothetical protein